MQPSPRDNLVGALIRADVGSAGEGKPDLALPPPSHFSPTYNLFPAPFSPSLPVQTWPWRPLCVLMSSASEYPSLLTAVFLLKPVIAVHCLWDTSACLCKRVSYSVRGEEKENPHRTNRPPHALKILFCFFPAPKPPLFGQLRSALAGFGGRVSRSVAPSDRDIKLGRLPQ
jgi:hypothetical protein